MPEIFSSLTDGVLAILPNILTAILIFAISYYAGVWLSRLLRRLLFKQNAEPGVSHLLAQLLKWTIISLGIIAALQRFFNITAFLTGLGIIGFTIGFAMQNIMQNFASGVILLVQQPFKVGDNVGIAGFDGTVLKIGLRTTEIKTLDGRIVFLPNADVLSQPIINYTRAKSRRVELRMSIPYDADTDLVREILLNETKSISGFVGSPEPLVLFHTFGAYSIDLSLLFWVDTSVTSDAAAKDAVLIRIKQAFSIHEIAVPYPVQVQLPANRPVKRKTKK
ncbi:MAG: mechanosensitive ion channel family protein [Anaerolineales bacterium]|nr:mechanosensitive ion channel family protein [Anaerolineales bacterium]